MIPLLGLSQSGRLCWNSVTINRILSIQCCAIRFRENGKPKSTDYDPEIATQAATDPEIVHGIDEDNLYAVFVTYVEIYNNSVFDLIEETPVQSRFIRKDAKNYLYVHGVTELEIISVEPAIENF